MKKIIETVRELAEPVVLENGCTLWDVEYVREAGQWYLRLYIDKEGGVDILDCEAISRRVSDLLDEAILRVGKPAREMNKADRLRVIERLKELDAFSYRRAVPYVASHLGVSRYTIYKYLDELREREPAAQENEEET